MSASVRIEIIGGTNIETAYHDCANVSKHMGGIAVETKFNGVEMFYYRQGLKEWMNDYWRLIKKGAKEGGAE